MRYWQRRLVLGLAAVGRLGQLRRPLVGRAALRQRPGTLTATYHERPNVTFHAALTGLDSVRRIRDYFEQREIDLGEFEPDHALAEDADGRKAAQAPRLMRRGQDEFLVYHPHAAADEQAAHATAGTTARLRLDLRDAPGIFAVEWYRAEDGRLRQTEPTSRAATGANLTAPGPVRMSLCGCCKSSPSRRRPARKLCGTMSDNTLRVGRAIVLETRGVRDIPQHDRIWGEFSGESWLRR